MAEDVIFVRRGEELVSLAVAPYEAEAVLQELLEHYPQLLAGYEMSRSDPRRFLLVCREAPVADQYGAGRWSLGSSVRRSGPIPTLVEVKRSSAAPGSRRPNESHTTSAGSRIESDEPRA
jgi:hypothetical protein